MERVEQIRGGDATAWRGLVLEHRDLILAICRSYGLGCDTARHVNQVVWLRLAEHLPRIRTEDMVGGWIAATTRAECLNPRYSTERSGWVVARIDAEGGEGGGRSRLCAAYARLGSRCQQVLRLLMGVPRLRREQVSAALDLSPDEVERTCESCLERLASMAPDEVGDLRAELGRLLHDGDHVPDDWWDDAEAAFAWLSLEAEYAELIYDSMPGSTGSGPRPRLRQLRYAAGSQGVDLSLDCKDGEVMLTGTLTPAHATKIVARWPAGSTTEETGDDGVFHFLGLPDAPLSLQTTCPTPLKTGWLLP